MRLSRNIISIFVDFLPPGIGGEAAVCMGIQHSSESRGQYLLRRAGLGSLLKSGVLLDRLLLRVMNFTSALNPTERYIY